MKAPDPIISSLPKMSMSSGDIPCQMCAGIMGAPTLGSRAGGPEKWSTTVVSSGASTVSSGSKNPPKRPFLVSRYSSNEYLISAEVRDSPSWNSTPERIL